MGRNRANTYSNVQSFSPPPPNFPPYNDDVRKTYSKDELIKRLLELLERINREYDLIVQAIERIDELLLKYNDLKDDARLIELMQERGVLLKKISENNLIELFQLISEELMDLTGLSLYEMEYDEIKKVVKLTGESVAESTYEDEIKKINDYEQKISEHAVPYINHYIDEIEQDLIYSKTRKKIEEIVNEFESKVRNQSLSFDEETKVEYNRIKKTILDLESSSNPFISLSKNNGTVSKRAKLKRNYNIKVQASLVYIEQSLNNCIKRISSLQEKTKKSIEEREFANKKLQAFVEKFNKLIRLIHQSKKKPEPKIFDLIKYLDSNINAIYKLLIASGLLRDSEELLNATKFVTECDRLCETYEKLIDELIEIYQEYLELEDMKKDSDVIETKANDSDTKESVDKSREKTSAKSFKDKILAEYRSLLSKFSEFEARYSNNKKTKEIRFTIAKISNEIISKSKKGFTQEEYEFLVDQINNTKNEILSISKNNDGVSSKLSIIDIFNILKNEFTDLLNSVRVHYGTEIRKDIFKLLGRLYTCILEMKEKDVNENVISTLNIIKRYYHLYVKARVENNEKSYQYYLSELEKHVDGFVNNYGKASNSK